MRREPKIGLMNGRAKKAIKRMNRYYWAKPKGMTRGRAGGKGQWVNESKSQRALD